MAPPCRAQTKVNKSLQNLPRRAHKNDPNGPKRVRDPNENRGLKTRVIIGERTVGKTYPGQDPQGREGPLTRAAVGIEPDVKVRRQGTKVKRQKQKKKKKTNKGWGKKTQFPTTQRGGGEIGLAEKKKSKPVVCEGPPLGAEDSGLGEEKSLLQPHTNWGGKSTRRQTGEYRWYKKNVDENDFQFLGIGAQGKPGAMEVNNNPQCGTIQTEQKKSGKRYLQSTKSGHGYKAREKMPKKLSQKSGNPGSGVKESAPPISKRKKKRGETILSAERNPGPEKK